MQEKSYIIYPEKSYNFWWFLAGFFLIPVFGLGIYLIFKKNRELMRVSYLITDRQITYKDQKISDTIDLISVQDIDLKQRWIDKKFGIGTLTIRTGTRSLELFGVKQPGFLISAIMSAAESERDRLSGRNKIKKKEPQISAGTLDRLDYLTGLWQQGLLSDEDFKKERKYFEN